VASIIFNDPIYCANKHGMLTPTPMVCKEMRYGGDAKSSIQRVMLMDAQLLILIRKLSES
jgi:hypothetical protein